MDIPIIIIVEFGQQRQRLRLKDFVFNINQLLELFSQTFHVLFNLQKYQIFLFNHQLDSMTKLDFTQLDNYQRFKIQLNNTHSSMIHDENEITSLKQRLNTAAIEIMEVSFLINSIHQDCKNLIKTLTDEDKSESSNENLKHHDLTVPPGFKPITHQKPSNTSPRDSQSTDEGIDRDTGSVSIFESAHSDHEYESIYLECREDATIINEPNPIMFNNDNKLEWRNQAYRSRPQWNSNKVKYQSNYNKDQFNDKSRSKKIVNLYKPPLPAEKKKNIPCKYAAGGNCKRGSQCRFIHVV